MFVGRKYELDVLNNLYKSSKFELLVITGRRRIGKSTLISKFIKGKPYIFFNAIEGNETLNLELLSMAYSEFENNNEIREFKSYYNALEAIFKKSLQEKFIFVIDEFPYLVNSYKPISSLLQFFIDKYKNNSKMLLILSGSSISFMENKVLAYKAPLFGRKTAQLKVEPLNFKDSFPYFRDFNNEEKVKYYSVYGGTPYYLNMIRNDLNFKENLKQTFLSNSSFLNDEPLNLLKQEVFDLGSYFSVLTAIANGATRLSEISTKVHLKTDHCAKIVKNLIELGLINKEFPYQEETNRKTLYKLNDNMFKFWFRFVPINQTLITRDLTNQAYNSIQPHLNEYIGPIFEDISKEYLWELLTQDKSPVIFKSLGRWWGTDNQIKSQIEIDIIGEEDSDTALFAECKWTNEKVKPTVLKNLIKKSQNFKYINKHYYIFSKSGFSPELIKMAKQIPNINLIHLDEIIDFLTNSTK